MRMSDNYDHLFVCVCVFEGKESGEVGFVNRPLDALNRAPCCGRGSCDYLGRVISIPAQNIIQRQLMYKLRKGKSLCMSSGHQGSNPIQ